MTNRLFATVVLTLAATAAPLRAQNANSAADFTPPCLRPELELIAFLEGDWDVMSSQRVSLSEDRWVESNGRATWEPVLAGCAMREHWSGTLDGTPIQWIQLLAWNHREETWQQVMLDTAHGNVIFAEGHFAEGRLIFNAPHLRRGELLIDRTTIEKPDVNHVEWIIETSQDGGKSWTRIWTLDYSRR